MTSHFESIAEKTKDSDTQKQQQQSHHHEGMESLSHGGQEARGKGRESGVHVTHAATERGSHHDHESTGGDRVHGGGGAAAAVLGQEGTGRVGVELRGEGREELESGAHGFHGEKARHAQLLAAGGEEIRERRGQESAGGGGGGRSVTDTFTRERTAS